MSKSAVVLPLACTALAFGAGTGATFVFRPKPPETAKAETPKVLRAERFEAADASGHVRGWMAATADGAVQFATADAEGRPRVLVTVDAKGAGTVEIRGADGKPVASLSSTESGARLALGAGEKPPVALSAGPGDAAELVMAAEGGTARARLASTAQGGTLAVTGPATFDADVTAKALAAASCEIRSADGKPRARLSVDAERGGTLDFLTPAGVPRLQLDERGTVAVNDAEGKPACALDTGAEGRGRIRVTNADGADVAVLRAGNGGGALELGNSEGKQVAALVSRDNGTPSLTLKDAATGKIRAWLDVASEGATTLGFYQADGTARQTIGLEKDGLPYHDFFDAAGKTRMTLYSRNDGESAFNLRNTEGRNLASLVMHADGHAFLSIADEKSGRAFLGVNDEGASVVGLSDPEGHPRAQGWVLKDGASGWFLRDDKGNIRFGAEADTTGRPYLEMLDDANKVRASLYLSTKNSGQLRFDDPGGIERLWLGYDDSGGVSLEFFDAQKRLRALVGTPASGSPYFSLHDESRMRLSFGLTSAGLPAAHLMDSNGKDRLQFGLLDNQGGRFNVLDGNDNVIWNSQ